MVEFLDLQYEKKYKIIDKKNRSHFNDVIALFVTSL